MKTKTVKFNVWGWFDGSSYDAGNPANCHAVVAAKDASEAEDKGERQFAKSHGKCDVIDSEEI
jgi:hypothetical protein